MNNKGELGCGITIWIIIIAIVCCCIWVPPLTEKNTIDYRKGECVRVFMHEPGSYSILDENFKSISFRHAYPTREFKGVKIIANVPKDKSMWWEGEYKYSDSVAHHLDGWYWVNIYIHGPEDINGAEFEEGNVHHRRRVKTNVVK